MECKGTICIIIYRQCSSSKYTSTTFYKNNTIAKAKFGVYCIKKWNVKSSQTQCHS